MATTTIQNFYYTPELPSRAVAIAQLSTPPTTPAQLTDVNNTASFSSLNIWKITTPITNSPDYVGGALNQTIVIQGVLSYVVDTPFFQITNVTSSDGTPLYYQHPLPLDVTNVVILDLNDVAVSTELLLISGMVYHSLDGSAYQIQYADSTGFITKELLHYDLVFTEGVYVAGATSYTFTGRTFTVATTGALYFRFTENSGYYALPIYTNQSNTPWYPRLRFAANMPTPEWARQVFLPQRPFIQANWVPGTVLSTYIVEFERKDIYYDPDYLPDILIYDSSYNFKYAIEGTKPGSPPRRGSEFLWKRGLISGIDVTNARLELQVPMDPTDIVYGFYSYNEPDLIFTDLDINPFTNPSVRDKVIEFYYKHNGISTFDTIYYQVIDPATGPIAGMTNDTSPTTGTNNFFTSILVGANASPSEFTITDARVRGGGLASSYQTIPEADSCWDIGYLDGKPYPIGGTLAVYLPGSILDILTRTDILARVNTCLPEGVLPIIRFYNSDGSEFI